MTPDLIPPSERETIDTIDQRIISRVHPHRNHHLPFLTVEDQRERKETTNDQGHFLHRQDDPCHPIEVEDRNQTKGPDEQIKFNVHF